jgi:hypothetical protein
MNNANQWVPVKRFAEVTDHSENTVRHKVKSGTQAGNSFVAFEMSESREHHQKEKGGMA